MVSGVQLETGNVANELNGLAIPDERCTNDVPIIGDFMQLQPGIRV